MTLIFNLVTVIFIELLFRYISGILSIWGLNTFRMKKSLILNLVLSLTTLGGKHLSKPVHSDFYYSRVPRKIVHVVKGFSNNAFKVIAYDKCKLNSWHTFLFQNWICILCCIYSTRTNINLKITKILENNYMQILSYFRHISRRNITIWDDISKQVTMVSML